MDSKTSDERSGPKQRHQHLGLDASPSHGRLGDAGAGRATGQHRRDRERRGADQRLLPDARPRWARLLFRLEPRRLLRRDAKRRHDTTRRRGDGDWDPTVHLDCDVNTPGNEASPFPLPQAHTGRVLYFSSTITGNGDLYYSAWHGGAFQGRKEVAGVNTLAWNEGQPNVRRDGLEIFYFSNQPDGIGGGNDIYSATRPSTTAAFSGAADLGGNVNSAAAETRPSLSWDGTTLYFGSTRSGGGAEGDADHYVTTRDALNGSDG
jgi:hypothetical protein